MASNSFGTIFRMTTWGESHGPAVGVIVDGCPAGINLDAAIINQALEKRAPGKRPGTSPRKEPDTCEILSGLFEGKTTGAPISILVRNRDADSSKYEPIKDLLRPCHANFTYLEKYGIFDYRGGGRASARETVARVAAGAVARQWLAAEGVTVGAWIKQIGNIIADTSSQDLVSLSKMALESSIFCPDPQASHKMVDLLHMLEREGDSIGGVVEFVAQVPAGLGDPVYEKLEAKLASAMMSLPASKGFEIGEGFACAQMRGSESNDLFVREHGKVLTGTNHSGGILGGISNGMPILGRVAFKPASSIKLPQKTLTVDGKEATFKLPEGSRHDPCVAIRAVPVTEAMVYLVLADAMLMNRGVKV